MFLLWSSISGIPDADLLGGGKNKKKKLPTSKNEITRFKDWNMH